MTMMHDYQDPATPCGVCQGSGTLYVEHPDGSLEESLCGYCKGYADSQWVQDNRRHHFAWQSVVKLGIVVYLLLLMVTFSLPAWSLTGDETSTSAGAKLYFVHLGLLALGVVAIFWWIAMPAPRRHQGPPKPPSFTDDRERLMGGAYLGGAYLKSRWDRGR